VIVVFHGFSFGLAIDIGCAADIRICAADTKFCVSHRTFAPSHDLTHIEIQVKEVDVGLAADIGTLSRLPKLGASLSWVKDVCYTARVFAPQEALSVGFVSFVLPDKAAAIAQAEQTAALIAAKSPVAVQGTKAIVEYSRDHAIEDGACSLSRPLDQPLMCAISRTAIHRRLERGNASDFRCYTGDGGRPNEEETDV